MLFAKNDYNKQLELGRELMRFLLEKFNFNQVPSWIGSLREKVVQRVLGLSDPYSELKQKSNELATKIWAKVKRKLNLDARNYETFRKILIYAAVANSVEWFISGYNFSEKAFMHDLMIAESKVSLDDSKLLWKDIQNSQSILYVLDNSGEAVIDLDVVRYLSQYVKEVFVAAREKPVLNDITVQEAIDLGFERIATKVIPVGWFIGIHLDKKELNPEFKDIFDYVDLVIAKGMGSYESLSEYKFNKPVYVILKAKCNPVANDLGVTRGTYVVKKI